MLSLLLLPLLTGSILAGNYLFWLPFSSKSMKIGVMDMVEELAMREHHVTVVSAYESKKNIPRVTEIVIKSDFEDMVKNALGKILRNEKGADVPWNQAIEESIKDSKQALLHPEVQKLLKNQKLDVVCVIPFGNEPGYYIAHKKNASLALLWTGVNTMPWINSAIGNPWNIATAPMALLSYSQDMTFLQRVINTGATVIIASVNEFYIRPKVDALLAESFPLDTSIPSISSLAKTSALLITHGSPFLGDGLRPLHPNSIQAALLSCKPITENLPKHLDDFLNNSEHGVIFVSFGSVISPSLMPESTRLMFVKVFKSVKQRVIWKWDVDMPDAPDNILVAKWLPQQALLAHRNLRLFITHAGAGSFQETICHKTPIVAVPINSDQPANAAEAVLRGFGVKVSWSDLSEATLATAIHQVLDNPSYQDKVEKLQQSILDTPHHPLERAVWWLEYALRHPSNVAMRSPEHQLYWAQTLLLDVILLILSVILVVGFLLRILLRCCSSALWKIKQKKD